MTFEKQLKEAKQKQLQNRIIRDVIFLLLGIIFLLFSIFSSIKQKNDEINKEATKNNISIKI